MIGLFRRIIIGGCSGSREGAWFVFLAFLGLAGFAAWAEYGGTPMDNTFALLTIAIPAAIALVGTAHGIQKAKDANWIAPKSVVPPAMPPAGAMEMME